MDWRNCLGMRIKPLRIDLLKYLKKRNLVVKYEKQVRFFEVDQKHPSLNTEILEPKNLRLYSFRIDRKYRAIFVYLGSEEVEVVDVNDHYQG